MKKLVFLAVVFAAVFALALPALGAGVVLTTNAHATLPVFPGSGNVSSLTGTATGLGTGQPSGAISLGTGGVHYNETTCEIGQASGNVKIGSSGDLALTWIRVGAVAVLRLVGGGQQGVAAAIFVANTGDFQSDCAPPGNTPGPMNAQIIAVGVAAP